MGSAESSIAVDASFAPFTVQQAVQNIYELDQLLSNDLVESYELVPHVLQILDDKYGLVRPLALLKALSKKP